jgi:hypothetical protein
MSSILSLDQRTKYLITKVNFINDLIENHIIELRYLPTDKNCADLNTKSLIHDITERFTTMVLTGMSNYTSK